MPIRLRKLIGTFLLVIFVITYALVAMALAVRIIPDQTSVWAFLFFIVGGVLWILPAGVIVWWMQKPDRPKEISSR